MARAKQLAITMIDQKVWYVHTDELNTFDVSESPDSFIGSYIRGSRGPMLRVNAAADMTGEERFINPALIVDLKVTYL
ncbi:hypothetical protein BSP36_059 [Bacillus phage BSP36]|uniref:Uncharacterized protein n=1 Tax=Bacillus phage BSP38 TaxID=2283013 RepID=A0A345MJS0_BPBSP|nr:hypothetical protein HWB82_gp060 [Bacillus phage BSP38]AXH71102.1 hypothetical protein BSP38_060 [Bacillus phage BSP38]AYJ75146.1 hypothetical protein BSP36_059 [Bacillus phage BSP36]